MADIASTGKGTAARVREMDKRQDVIAENVAYTRAEVSSLSKQMDRMMRVITERGMS